MNPRIASDSCKSKNIFLPLAKPGAIHVDSAATACAGCLASLAEQNHMHYDCGIERTQIMDMNEMIQLVPLGAWCRTAHQTRMYAESREGLCTTTFPYDWMITSFAALGNTLDPDFDPASVLQPEQTTVSQFQSGICNTSGVIFHHAIGPEQLEKIGDLTPGDAMPDTPKALSLMQTSRERFQHTYEALNALKSDPGPLIFVRWQRFGHPDRQFPEAFEGEDPKALSAVIAKFLGHDDFYLLVVETEPVLGVDVIPDPVVTFVADARIITGRIQERPGWNGRDAPNFRGDEASWEVLLDRALDTWG